MIKLALGKQSFVSTVAKFDCEACNDCHNTQNFGGNTCNFGIDMVLSA